MHSNKSHLLQRPNIHDRLIVIEEKLPVPPLALQQVVAFCPHHTLPLPMRLYKTNTTPHGQTIAVFRCHEPHCGYQQSWIQDTRTSRPRPHLKLPSRSPRPEDFSY